MEESIMFIMDGDGKKIFSQLGTSIIIAVTVFSISGGALFFIPIITNYITTINGNPVIGQHILI